jgi:hypothetical protein
MLEAPDVTVKYGVTLAAALDHAIWQRTRSTPSTSAGTFDPLPREMTGCRCREIDCESLCPDNDVGDIIEIEFNQGSESNSDVGQTGITRDPGTDRGGR